MNLCPLLDLEGVEDFAYSQKDLFLLYSRNRVRLINREGKQLLFLDSFEKEIIFACLECNSIFVVLCNGEICIFPTESATPIETLNPFSPSQALSASCYDEIVTIVHSEGVLISLSCSSPSTFKKWKLSGNILHAFPLKVWQTSCTSPTLHQEAAKMQGNTYLAVGSAPSIGIYHSPEWKPKISLHSAINSAYSFAKSFIPRKAQHPTSEKEKSFAASVLTLQHFFDDAPRVCTRILALHPKYAAIADNFGRILVLDLKGCIVLRVLKGFRDSFVYFEGEDIVIASKQRNSLHVTSVVHSQKEEDKTNECTNEFPVSNWIQVENSNGMFIDRQTKKLFSVKQLH